MGISKPHVILNAAMTLDGKIATRSHDAAISSQKDLNRVYVLRSKVDAVMVGINTVRIDDPMLTARNMGTDPARIIVDSKASISLRSKIIRTSRRIRTVIAVATEAPERKVTKLRESGASVVICGRQKVDLARLLNLLGKMEISKILLEGGGELNWNMLNKGLVDEMIVTIAPKIVGGRRAITLVEGHGIDRVRDGFSLTLRKTRKHGDEIVLFYKVCS